MFLLFTRPSREAPLRRSSSATDVDGDEAIVGCGWFDSSHDLKHGLRATEWLPSDPLPVTVELETGLAA